MAIGIMCRNRASDSTFGIETDGGAVSMTYDKWKATDCAGDAIDATYAESQDDKVELVQRQSMLCKCRACGDEFAMPYDEDTVSYICDGCLAKPLPKPRGIFEP